MLDGGASLIWPANPYMAWIVVFVGLVFALALYLLAKRRPIPWGKIMYSDVLRIEKPLYSKTLAIAGKPDFILKKGDNLIPVEYKSSKKPLKPYKSHILQLAAYCWLIEENYNVKSPYGYIVYGKTKFKVKYDDRLRGELINTVGQMRNFLKLSLAEASQHRNGERCRKCSSKQVCNSFAEQFTKKS